MRGLGPLALAASDDVRTRLSRFASYGGTGLVVRVTMLTLTFGEQRRRQRDAKRNNSCNCLKEKCANAAATCLCFVRSDTLQYATWELLFATLLDLRAYGDRGADEAALMNAVWAAGRDEWVSDEQFFLIATRDDPTVRMMCRLRLRECQCLAVDLAPVHADAAVASCCVVAGAPQRCAGTARRGRAQRALLGVDNALYRTRCYEREGQRVADGASVGDIAGHGRPAARGRRQTAAFDGSVDGRTADEARVGAGTQRSSWRCRG